MHLLEELQELSLINLSKIQIIMYSTMNKKITEALNQVDEIIRHEEIMGVKIVVRLF